MLRRILAMVMLQAALAGIAAVAVLASGSARTEAQAPTTTPSPLGEGQRLYLEACAWCHASDGSGTNSGPSLLESGGASVDFMLSTGRMPIDRPEVQSERRDPVYTPEEIDAIVDYVSTFSFGPDVPTIDPASGDIAEGAELYLTNCAACHSGTGIGAALTSGQEAPPIRPATSLQIAEAVRTGPGTMPVFGPDAITDEQLNSLLRYTEAVKRPEDRGGNGLLHLGPIAEGFVAWALGMVLVVGFLRWIGTTAKE